MPVFHTRHALDRVDEQIGGGTGHDYLHAALRKAGQDAPVGDT